MGKLLKVSEVASTKLNGSYDANRLITVSMLSDDYAGKKAGVYAGANSLIDELCEHYRYNFSAGISWSNGAGSISKSGGISANGSFTNLDSGYTNLTSVNFAKSGSATLTIKLDSISSIDYRQGGNKTTVASFSTPTNCSNCTAAGAGKVTVQLNYQSNPAPTNFSFYISQLGGLTLRFAIYRHG